MRVELAETRRQNELSLNRRRDAARLLIVADGLAPLAGLPLAAAEAAQENGFEVHIAIAEDGRRPAGEGMRAAALIEAAGLAFHRIPSGGGRNTALRGIALIRAYDALIERLRPDLIHCVGFRPRAYMGSVARLRRVPAILSMPSGEQAPGARSAGLRQMLRRAVLGFAAGSPKAAVIVQCGEDKTRLGAKYGSLGRRTFLIRGAAVDLALFHPRAANERKPGPPIVMLSASGASPSALESFAAAGALLRAKGVAARFVILGRRGRRDSDSGPVEWWNETADRPAAIRQADIICVIADCAAGIPEILVQAAASGVPTVVNESAAARRVVRHGLNGLIAPSGEAPALAAAFEQALGEPTFLASAGLRAREIAEAEFALPSFLTASLAVYHAALGLAPAGSEDAAFVENRRAS